MSKTFGRLTEKYRPRRVSDLIGLPKIKTVITNYLEDPYAAAFLFAGPSGCGKTVLALAMAEALHTKPLHLASETCNYDNLDKVLRECEYVPGSLWNGPQAKFHFILIDEIDSTTATAQRRLLAKLDSSELVANAVFVFTTNTIKAKKTPTSEGLEERFISRCIQLDFSMWGASKEIADFLGRVWRAEGGNGEEPNWERVVTDKRSNVRDCLQYVEAELLARGRNGSFAESVGIRSKENCTKSEEKSRENSLWPSGPLNGSASLNLITRREAR